MKLPLSQIADVVSGAMTGSIPPNSAAIGYSIDSRTIRPGELFFAVKGEKMDGHDFVWQAIEKGAIAAVASREHISASDSLVILDAPGRGGRTRASAPTQSKSGLMVVEDTLQALQVLAKTVRRLWARP